MKRRFFLLAAPAIVAAPSLMRVSAAVLDSLPSPDVYISDFGTYNWEPSLSGIIKVTLRNHSAKIAEAMLKNNALWQRLRQNNLVGGTESWTYYGRLGATLDDDPQ